MMMKIELKLKITLNPKIINISSKLNCSGKDFQPMSMQISEMDFLPTQIETHINYIIHKRLLQSITVFTIEGSYAPTNE